MKTTPVQLNVIDTTVLDEVNLLVEKCSQIVEAADITIDWINDNPDQRHDALESFSEFIIEFNNHAIRLLEIIGHGPASDLLFNEVRNNIMNIIDSDRIHAYMQGVVFVVGKWIQRLELQIENIESKFVFTHEDALDLINQLDTVLSELDNDKLEQKEIDRLNEEGIRAVDWLHFHEFYRALVLLKIALKEIRVTTDTIDVDPSIDSHGSPNPLPPDSALSIQPDTDEDLYEALAPLTQKSHRVALRALLKNGTRPAEKIVITGRVKNFGLAIYCAGAVPDGGADRLSKQLPDYFIRYDGSGLVTFKDSILVKYLRGKKA